MNLYLMVFIKEIIYLKYEYKSIGIHWITLYIDDSNVTYFDSLAVEHIPKEIKTFIVNKNITINIYKVQAYDSIM